jgi:uncharacterized protein (TIGR03000 family)
MRIDDATTRIRWRRKAVLGALVVLGLVGVGVPNGRAQMRYNGGYRVYHRYAPPDTFRPEPTPPTEATVYFPDNDSYYPSYSSAATSVTRSYYPGEAAGRSASPSAGESPLGVPTAALPWNQVGFGEYDEQPEMSFDSPLAGPSKYTLEATPLAPESPAGQSEAGQSETATLIVHLPEHAMFWVEGSRTLLKGQTTYFRSPPLAPGKKYGYTVRAAWLEDGRWVGQTRRVPVEAGSIQALYLWRSPGKRDVTKKDK